MSDPLIQALRKAHEEGNIDDAKQLAKIIARQEAKLDQFDAAKEGYAQTAREATALESFGASMGRGLTQVGRGAGIVEPMTQEESEVEQAIYDAKEKERPYTSIGGEIVGQALPFVPAGMGVGAIPQQAARIGAGGLLGATEGNLIARGTGGDVAESTGIGGVVGAGAEYLAPRFGRAISQAFRRLGISGQSPLIDSAGAVTPEFQTALDDVGLTVDDVIDTSQAMTPEQAANQALFQREGIPATKGDITQEFSDQATEQKLLQSQADTLADPFRQYKSEQSQAIRSGLESFIDDLGIPEAAGDSVKEALKGRRNLLRSQKNRFYREASDLADESGDIPMFGDQVAESMPSDKDRARWTVTNKDNLSQIDGLLEMYGIAGDPEAMQFPLTLSNFDDLRTGLNEIVRGDPSGKAAVIAGPIIDALDNEADAVLDSVDPSAIPKEMLDTLKAARKTTKQLKTEFNPKGLVGKLTENVKNSEFPMVEASKVYDKLSTRSTPVENVTRVMDSLRKSEGGDEAINALKSNVVMDLMDAAFSANTNRIAGVSQFSPNAFAKAYSKLGDDKIKEIFKGDNTGYQRLKNFIQIADKMIPDNKAVPKGSASNIFDALNRLGILSISSKIPVAGLVVERGQQLATDRATRQGAERAMQGRGDFLAEEITGVWPSFGRALAMSATPVAVSANQGEQN